MPFRLLIGLIFVLTSTFSWAEKDEFSLNLNDVDMRVMIDTVADITGKNFIVDPHVVGKVSMITAKPMRATQIYQIFLSILKVHGFAAVANGNVVKIVPNISAKQESTTLLPEGGEDDLMTKIIELHFVDAAEMVQVLTPLVPQHAFISAFPNSNVIVISDTVGNVNRLVDMISRIDKNGHQQIEVIALQNAKSLDVVTSINSLLTAKSAGKTGNFLPTLSADERSNSVLLSGDPNSRLEIRALIEHLDNPVEKTLGNTEVIYLHYAVAKELMATLTGTKASKDGKTDINNQAKTEASTKKNVDIRADDATNALIITASEEEMRSLKAVIKQLDIRRAQIHIEAIIAKIDFTKEQEVGVEWHTKQLTNGISANAFTNNLGDFVTNSAKTFSVGYLVGGEIRALLAAFAKDTNVNVLSTPSVVTLDNEEASMIVGQNIGVKTGSISSNASSSGLAGAATTFQRQDVGTKLTVTPLINEGNAVKLKIKQEVSSVVKGTNNDDSGPTIDKSEIDTAVLVDDGAILVLGGLISDDVQETVTKVPLLGDIPYIGHLFQDRTSNVTKQNLMVFLRPHILRDPVQSSQLTNNKYNDIRSREQKAGKNGVYLMPNEHPPLLPEVKPSIPKYPAVKPQTH
ncbi:GspD family T2SS secretin variant XcpQ [Methylosoma difficile]